MFKFLDRFRRTKWEEEPQKQLTTGPIIIECGLCYSHFDSRNICAHWVDDHTGFYRLGGLVASEHEGVMRIAPVVNRGVFVVRRPDYQKYIPYFNPELLNGYYFAFALVRLQELNPHLRFTGDSDIGADPTGLLKVRNFLVEWDKE